MHEIIINGSRRFLNYAYLRIIVKQFVIDHHIDPKDIEIISGGAKGADTLAIRFAHEYNLKLTIMYPDWDKNGKRAGIIRNIDMLDYAMYDPEDIPILISFWDGKSRGTKHLIDECTSRGVEVYLNYVGGMIC